jgi:hypothetical protein
MAPMILHQFMSLATAATCPNSTAIQRWLHHPLPVESMTGGGIYPLDSVFPRLEGPGGGKVDGTTSEEAIGGASGDGPTFSYKSSGSLTLSYEKSLKMSKLTLLDVLPCHFN